MGDDLYQKDEDLEGEDIDSDFDDEMTLDGSKKGGRRGGVHDDETESLEDLADIEEGLPEEDLYDDTYDL